MDKSQGLVYQNQRYLFIKTNVICEYPNLLLGHRIEEPVRRMTTLGKLQIQEEPIKMHGSNHQ